MWMLVMKEYWFHVVIGTNNALLYLACEHMVFGVRQLQRKN